MSITSRRKKELKIQVQSQLKLAITLEVVKRIRL